jgi:hypothetical protein
MLTVSTRFAAAWLSKATQRGRWRLAASCCAGAVACVLCSLVCGQLVWGQTAKSKTAAVTCATCHAGVTANYAHAPMRHAMEAGGANPVLDKHPNLTAQVGGYSYSIQTKDGKSTYSVTNGTETLTLPIKWMFGTHSQTWVLEKDGHLYESYVTYFARGEQLGITPGDQRITPTNLTEAMGRKLPIWETQECFKCHASGAVDGAKLTLDTLRPGLDCERCHVGAQQHMADAEHDNFKTLPKSLTKMDAENVSNLCGSCHRTWDTVMRNHWQGPAFVRFQPYRLEHSRCFIGNDARISCLACHDPHQAVDHSDAVYDAKCLACHGAAKVAVAESVAAGAVTPKICPVSKDKCVSCHMPKVELPGGQAVFTDHFIRVVKAGEAYPD